MVRLVRRGFERREEFAGGVGEDFGVVGVGVGVDNGHEGRREGRGR
jgi:hypothetical protein